MVLKIPILPLEKVSSLLYYSDNVKSLELFNPKKYDNI